MARRKLEELNVLDNFWFQQLVSIGERIRYILRSILSFKRRNIVSNGEIFDVLVVEKRNGLKVIDILK